MAFLQNKYLCQEVCSPYSGGPDSVVASKIRRKLFKSSNFLRGKLNQFADDTSLISMIRVADALAILADFGAISDLNLNKSDLHVTTKHVKHGPIYNCLKLKNKTSKTTILFLFFS